MHAGTLTVPAQYATIQAAVNAAARGDRSVVAAGVCSENVRVPGCLDGLVLQGKGKGKNTILDARPLGAIGSGNAVRLDTKSVH